MRHSTLRTRRKTGPQQDSSASVLLCAAIRASCAPLPLLQAQHQEASRYEWEMAELYVPKVLWGLQVNAHTSCRAKDTYRATDAVAAAGQREVNMGPTYT